MAIVCDVSAECGGLACIEHHCVEPADVLRERERARAPVVDPVRKHYFGATFAPFASLGLEGRNVTAAGGDFFAGARLARWFSFEVFYTYDFEIGRSSGPLLGGMCPALKSTPPRTWFGDWFRWQTLGVRAWFHPVHSAVLDFSAAPFASGGFSLDHTSTCGSTDFVAKGAVLELGTAFAVEARPVPWLGVRLSVEALIDVGISVGAIRGSVGPVFRF